MPDEPVVDNQPPNDLKPAPIIDLKSPAPKPTPKPAENPIEHPKFQERINGFVGQISHLQRQLEKQNLTQETDRQALKTLLQQNNDMAKLLEKVEDKVSTNATPNYEDDPQGYTDYRFNQVLDKIDKKEKPPSSQPYAPSPPATNQEDRISMQREVQMGLHSDYLEVWNNIQSDIAADPALMNTFLSNPNPPKAAYDYGIRRKKLAEEARLEKLNQGYVEGGAPVSPTQDLTSLTAVEKALADNLGISEAKYLGRKQLIAKRKGK